MDPLVLASGLAMLVMPPADPPLSDLHRFPAAAVAKANYDFATEHRNWVNKQKPLAPRDESRWLDWQAEAAHCRKAWDNLWDANQVQLYDANARRKWLYRLRVTIGEEDYWIGRMPPPVPLWRFEKRGAE